VRMSRKKSASIIDVAVESGFSKTTVGYVLAGQAKEGRVADKTAEKVRDAAKKLGYIPNHWARTLRKKRTGMISVLFPSLELSWAARVMIGIEKTFIPKGYTPVITLYGVWVKDDQLVDFNSGIDHAKIEMVLQRRDEGVICQPSPRVRQGYVLLNEQNVPMVLIGSLMDNMEGLENVNSVIWDCKPAAKTVMRHLIKTGRKKIAFVGGRHGVQSDAARFEAYKESLKEASLPINPRWIVWADLESPLTVDLIKPMFADSSDCPDAVFAINDAIAISVLDMFRILGLRMYDDVALAGMGDLPVTNTSGITSVKEPIEEIGRISAEILLEILKDPHRKPTHRKVSCNELIIRESTVLSDFPRHAT